VLVKSPVTKEALKMIKVGLGLVVNGNSDDLEIVSQASFYAGATAVMERYLMDDGSVVMTRLAVAQYAKEAAEFAINHRTEEMGE
jgi:hypothetical protein